MPEIWVPNQEIKQAKIKRQMRKRFCGKCKTRMRLESCFHDVDQYRCPRCGEGDIICHVSVANVKSRAIKP